MADDEQQPLLKQKQPAHLSGADSASTLVRDLDVERQVRPAASSPRSLLDLVADASSGLSRRGLLGVIFLGTLVGTLIAVFSLNSLSSLPPRGEVNYAAVGNQLDLLRQKWGNQGCCCRGSFGIKNEKGDPVTLDTLFEIGSNTKAFTSIATAILVEKGKLDWKTPVSKLYPGFEFKDPIANEHATLIDILSHRSGLPRHDLMFKWNSSEEIISRIKYLEPTAQFREKYQYNNLMYLLAGTIAGRVYDEGWESLIQRTLLEPIEMFNTYPLSSKAQSDPEISQGFVGNKATGKSASTSLDVIAPAGAIVSSVKDLAKWVTFLQEKGLTVHNRRVLSEAAFDNLWHQHTPVTAEVQNVGDYPSVEHVQSYGLGFHILSYRGKRLVSHGGATNGYRSEIFTLPKEKLSIIILCNSETDFPDMAARYILDKVAFLKTARSIGTTTYGKFFVSVPNPSDSSRDFGKVDLLLAADQNPFTLELQHWANDTFGVMREVVNGGGDGLPFTLVTFSKKEGEEKMSTVSVVLEPAVGKPVTFVRSA
ncbi:beta-lactamase/transpeptidase-like protein [Chytridium lagenaria]|nr:beta-lactamase/transpeptidase-like protein [Chytridium lagenaria]